MRKLSKLPAVFRRRNILPLAASIAALLKTGTPAKATVYYWDTITTGLWSDGANWSDNATTGGTTGVVPGSLDTVFFNQSSVNGAETVQLSGNQSIAGITFANTGTTLIQSDSAVARDLTIGSSGITVNSGAGAVTLGNATNIMNIKLGAAQAWANNSSNALTVVNGVSLANAGAQTFTLGAGSFTFNGAISNGSGTLALTKSGTGTVILTGANNYTGATNIGVGSTLQLGNGGATGGTLSASSAITNNGSLVFNNSYAQFAYTQGTQFASNITGTGSVTLAAGELYVAPAGATNNYSGGFNLQAGRITTGNNALAFGTGTLTISGGTIDTSTNGGAGTTLSTTNTNIWSGNFTLNYRQTSGVWNNNGTVTLSGSGVTRTVTGQGTAMTLNLNQPVGDGGNNNGLGFTTITANLAAANTYTGATTLNSGTLTLSNTLALQNSSALNTSTGTTLNLRSNSTASFTTPLTTLSTSGTTSMTIDVNRVSAGSGNTLTLGGGLKSAQAHGNVTTLNFTGGNTYLLNIPTLILETSGSGGSGGGLTLNPTATSVTIGSLVATTMNKVNLVTLGGTTAGNSLGGIAWSAANAISLTKNNTSTWSLTGPANHTGVTTLAAGTLNINHQTAIGAAASNFTITGGTFNNTSGNPITLANNNPQTWTADFTFTGTNNLNMGTGTVNFGPTTAGGTRTVTISANTLTVGGVISNGTNATPTTNLTKAGAGTLNLTGSNSFSGTLTVSAGTLAVSSVNNASAAGPLGNSANAVTLGGSGTTGTLQYNAGAATTTKSFTMATSGTGAFDVGNGNQTLTLNATTNATTGSGALSKTGAGGLIFTTAPGHTGGTTINRGTLALSGALNMPATGALTVNGGGTFSLAEATATARTTTVNGGLTISTGANFNFDWVNAAVDSLTTTALVTPTAGAVVGIGINASTPSGGPLTLISSSNGSSALNNASYFLANASNYTATLSSTATTVTINNYASVAAPSNIIYWTGNKLAGASTAGVDNALALSNGTVSNWSFTPSTSSYTGTALTPGSASDLFFSNVQFDKAQQTTVLGADMTVNSITIDDSTAVTIGGSNSIKLLSTGATIGAVDQVTGIGSPGGSTAAAISVTANAANPTISANVILGSAGQTWRVATGKTLSVSGSISGLNGFTIAGGGTLALSGTNFYTGGHTITGGSTLQIDSGGTIGVGSSAIILGGSASTSIGKLTVNTNATTGAITANTDTASNNVIAIGNGVTLTTAGNVAVGADAAGITSKLQVTGSTGSWIVTNNAGSIQVGVATGGTNSSTNTLDMSGLGTFNANLGSTGLFRIGDNNTATTGGNTTVTLAATSTITAGTLGIGDVAGANANFTLNLGSGTQTINADTINIAIKAATSGIRSNGTLQFNGSTGTLNHPRC